MTTRTRHNARRQVELVHMTTTHVKISVLTTIDTIVGCEADGQLNWTCQISYEAVATVLRETSLFEAQVSFHGNAAK